jgi:hypothetical protein
MSNDPIGRVRIAFSRALAHHRLKRNLTTGMVADAGGFSVSQIEGWESKDKASEPGVTDFFRLAWALGTDPTILFIDMITEWRYDPKDIGLYKSRVSDLAKLYRLGYFVHPGDFRELPTTYSLVDSATDAARELNIQRQKKRNPLLDTVCIYVRLGHIWLDQQPGERSK